MLALPEQALLLQRVTVRLGDGQHQQRKIRVLPPRWTWSRPARRIASSPSSLRWRRCLPCPSCSPDLLRRQQFSRSSRGRGSLRRHAHHPPPARGPRYVEATVNPHLCLSSALECRARRWRPGCGPRPLRTTRSRIACTTTRGGRRTGTIAVSRGRGELTTRPVRPPGAAAPPPARASHGLRRCTQAA